MSAVLCNVGTKSIAEVEDLKPVKFPVEEGTNKNFSVQRKCYNLAQGYLCF